MIRVPLWGYLGAALAASLAANGFLAWQWAQSKPECEQKRTGDVLEGVAVAVESKIKKDRIASEVARESAKQTDQAIAEADTAAKIGKEIIREAYQAPPAPLAPGCIVPHPVDERVQRAIDSAVERTNR